MKSLKKVTMLLISILVATCFGLVFTTTSKAATGSRYLTIKQLRASGYGYKALEKNIWKICESNSSGTVTNYDHTIYCVKGGAGFGSSAFGSGTPTVREYTRYFDLKNKSSIPSSYANLIPVFSNGNYSKLVKLLENIYIAPKANATTEERQTASEYRDLLLKKAGLEDSSITDDDIDAVQQLAVWHFTNPGDAYDVGEAGTFEFWINAVAGSDSNYNALSDENGAGAENGFPRSEDCNTLYEYLINLADNEGQEYTPTPSTAPYTLAKTTIKQKTVGDNYIIGPFKINKTSDTTGTLNATIKNGNTIITPKLQDIDDEEIASLEDSVGYDFYIVLPKTTNIENISLEISGSYFDTSLTYWSTENTDGKDQPVVEVKRTKTTYSDSAKFTPEVEKKFDLALRKFIVSINGVAPSVSREPQISNNTLKDLADGKITTAVKTHPKTALEVKKGDKVIYTIRVYNEGEVDGYVTEITDYLPDGLKLAENSTVNTNNGWKSTDGKKITTDKLKGTKLAAFNKQTLELKYLDVQIECEVTAESPAIGKTTLKNIAEITGANGGKDVDSTPDNVNKDNYGSTSQEDDDDFEDLVLKGEKFDLALRKFITSINNVAPTVSREPKISADTLKDLADGKITTAVKVHPKNALEVSTGDKVVYTIRVYNEGKADGYVKEITDYLPEGLKFVENSTINTENGWKNPSGDGKTITTDKLTGTLLKGFDGQNLQYLDVQIECEVIATISSKDNVLKNIAEITKHADKDGNETVKDEDSTPDNVKRDDYGTTSQEDDDDFEQLIIPGKYFDLALRKFISAVGDNELVDENGNYTRAPKVDVTPLLNGKTTAIYNHSKKAVNVNVGDIVTYTIRVYNEGEIDGYVKEITDHLPQYLEFVNDEFNAQYGWKVSNDGRTVTTDITSPDTEYSASRDTLYKDRAGNIQTFTQEHEKNYTLLKAFYKNSTTLDYIDVKIRCKVKDTIIAEKITNIADITKQSDKNGNNITDRDSTPGNVTLPTDELLPEYKDDEINRGDEYIPGQEDDDDFEKVIVQKFDLALRKFITGVNDKEVSGRVPSFSMDENGKMTYTHPKTPVDVVNGDTVIYTLRIYNEGNQAGYANEVKDNIPDGLVYLPDNELNKTYRWKMYDKDGNETTNANEAKTIKTDYLSYEQEQAENRDNLIKAFDKGTMTQPDYRDVKVAFKVTEPNTSDRILINTAEISDDRDEKGNTVDDIDSTPDNNKDGEDDQDIEKVKVKYFDLALEKIITEYSIKLNGKTTTTKTGHKFGVQPEPVVKVETLKNTRKNAVIKFKYQIKVTNEGEIEGYADEIKDYIPDGLKFVQEDNPKWKLSEDGKTVTTDQLKNRLLKPGESAIVEITFQWINGDNNLGLKQNWAEISKDRNDSNTPDIDSTPDNFKKGEDDIDDASVILSVVTGVGENYILITGAVLAIIAGGLVLIKKFVI